VQQVFTLHLPATISVFSLLSLTFTEHSFCKHAPQPYHSPTASSTLRAQVEPRVRVQSYHPWRVLRTDVLGAELSLLHRSLASGRLLVLITCALFKSRRHTMAQNSLTVEQVLIRGCVSISSLLCSSDGHCVLQFSENDSCSSDKHVQFLFNSAWM
jgi:hypothetical protein